MLSDDDLDEHDVHDVLVKNFSANNTTFRLVKKSDYDAKINEITGEIRCIAGCS